MPLTADGPTVKQLVVLSIPAVAVGAGSALVLWLLDVGAGWLQDQLWTTLPGLVGATSSTPWWIILTMTVIGAAVGLVVWLMPGHAGNDSAVGGLEGPPPPLVALPSLLIAVVLGLAGGVSLGPENPIMAINGALTVALFARMSKAVPPNLAVLLAASGTLGALFGTPVGAALAFTGTLAAIKGGGSLWDRMFLPLASAGAGAITMHLLGAPTISFSVEPMTEVGGIDLLTGALVAGVAALAAIAIAWAFPYVHRAFHSMKNPLIFTTLGGLVLGILGAIGGPITMFKGLEETGELLADPDEYTALQLAAFAGIKLIALLVAASAGFRGGRIFPMVFIGVAIGLVGYAVIPGMPISLAVACGVLGTVLVSTRDGWIALFVAAIVVGDPLVLPVMCVVILPIWLMVTRAPALEIAAPEPAEPTAPASPSGPARP
ncbi:ion channel protein [Agromyces sp. NPDC058126]|uniref:ion channel protein n=1 Tax=Agromyces sp. NPDC058126 TaxID=3346350 RepID=UPI0036D8BC99